jgi:uncharacterized membrane protein YkgB
MTGIYCPTSDGTHQVAVAVPSSENKINKNVQAVIPVGNAKTAIVHETKLSLYEKKVGVSKTVPALPTSVSTTSFLFTPHYRVKGLVHFKIISSTFKIALSLSSVVGPPKGRSKRENI